MSGFFDWLIDEFAYWVVIAIVSVAAAGVVAIVATTVYFEFTGGTSYLDHQKVNGIECIVVRDRWTNEPNSTSCPPVQNR